MSVVDDDNNHSEKLKCEIKQTSEPIVKYTNEMKSVRYKDLDRDRDKKSEQAKEI